MEDQKETFEPFQSIPRLKRGCVITEKIDGTNAQVFIGEDGIVRAGSRNRWITPENDNHGFARWVAEHEDESRTGLGPGRHFGEWWGAGIQRRYGLIEKRFSMFNAGRWTAETPPPACCHVVPVVFTGTFSTGNVDAALLLLETNGSLASPGFMQPEGVVIYLPSSRSLYKATLDGDGHKGSKSV